MNYFSHDVILPEGVHPLVRVGSALPDLWARIPKRPLPFRLLPALRADGSAELAALANGIESHLLADEVFHRHPEFLDRIDRVEAEIMRFWPTVGHAEMAAHILIEMVLDRRLMAQDPAKLAGYYASFTAEQRAFAARHGAMEEVAREALAGVLAAFAEARFLEDYVTPAGLASRFCRAWARTPFAGDDEPPHEELAAWVEQSAAALAPRSEVLVDAARAAAAPLFRVS